MRKPEVQRLLFLFSLILALVLPTLFPNSAQAFAFREVKTKYGLTLWLVPQEEAKTVQIVVHNPIGSSYDLEGKEGLAHLVEHMLFTDNAGKTELEYFKELESRGGSANGYTNREETVYTLSAPSQETALALDWIRRLLFNHQFKREAFEKERKIVVLESNLSPSEPLDYLKSFYGLLDIFDLPDFWEQEFGISQDDRSVGGSYDSVHRISLEDIQGFYDYYYRSDRLKVFIVGNFDADVVAREVQTNFFFARDLDPEATVADKPAEQRFTPPAPWKLALKNPKRYKQVIGFVPSGSLSYRNLFKVYDPSQEEALLLFFLKDFLREYFNDELRFKEHSTYAISTDVAFNRNAAYFEVGGDFALEHYEKAKTRIEGVLEQLRQGKFSAKEFDEYRDRAQVHLKLRTKSPEDSANVFEDYYANAAIFSTFPDQIDFYREVDSSRVAEFLQKWLVHENQVAEINHRAPLSQTTQIGLLVIFLVFVFSFLRHHWLSPIDLVNLHYIRKIHYSIFQWLLFWLVFALFYTFYQSAIQSMFERFRRFYQISNIFWLHLFCWWIFSALWLFLSLLPFTYIPRKILLFSDHLLLKFWSYRSWKIPYEKVQSLKLIRLWKFLASRKFLGTFLLSFGLFTPALLLKGKKGWGLFFHTNNDKEFLKTFRELSGRK